MDDTTRQKIAEGLEEIMHPPVSVSPDAPTREALKVLLENRVPGVPVEEDGELVGFISDGHLLSSALPEYLLSLRNLFLLPEVARMEIGSSIFAAAHEMKRKGVSSLIVTRGGTVVGIVHRLDLYADIEEIELS